MNRYEVRLECLKIALRENYKVDEALRARVDLYYDIASNGEELPTESPKVQIFNAFSPPPADEANVGDSVALDKNSGNPEKPQAKAKGDAKTS